MKKLDEWDRGYFTGIMVMFVLHLILDLFIGK